MLHGSNVFVNVKCDNKNCNNPILLVQWNNYVKSVKGDGKYYCKKCATKLYGNENKRLSKLRSGKSFEQWCVENNRQDILDRWDYELNIYKPNDINSRTHHKYYFKCPRGLHKSELKNIVNFTNSNKSSMDCKQCNSFAQWGIDNLGSDFLKKYWDYEKNKISPWILSYSSNKKVWIKCQEKDYHESYPLTCTRFINGNRCPYCSNRHGKVHKSDSLGSLYPQTLKIWSDKNKKSPYEYAPMSNEYVYWKCPEKIHDDYYRNIHNSNLCEFRCPSCQFSKGEQKIEEYLIKNKIVYIAQKEFNKLVGINNGNLSYDFYLPDYNLLIEYQGKQHKKFIKGFHQSKKDFDKQKEHDTRKREYAENNNIKLLEIWYYDFDNIEKILSNYLKGGE